MNDFFDSHRIITVFHTSPDSYDVYRCVVQLVFRHVLRSRDLRYFYDLDDLLMYFAMKWSVNEWWPLRYVTIVVYITYIYIIMTMAIGYISFVWIFLVVLATVVTGISGNTAHVTKNQGNLIWSCFLFHFYFTMILRYFKVRFCFLVLFVFIPYCCMFN